MQLCCFCVLLLECVPAKFVCICGSVCVSFWVTTKFKLRDQGPKLWLHNYHKKNDLIGWHLYSLLNFPVLFFSLYIVVLPSNFTAPHSSFSHFTFHGSFPIPAGFMQPHNYLQKTTLKSIFSHFHFCYKSLNLHTKVVYKREK